MSHISSIININKLITAENTVISLVLPQDSTQYQKAFLCIETLANSENASLTVLRIAPSQGYGSPTLISNEFTESLSRYKRAINLSAVFETESAKYISYDTEVSKSDIMKEIHEHLNSCDCQISNKKPSLFSISSASDYDSITQLNFMVRVFNKICKTRLSDQEIQFARELNLGIKKSTCNIM